ncbi:S8 family serine peptidase [Streptomyces sp. NPDC093801]|uniref:S8 family serine peptidase n=1 Tax=Streptomyces sp. NPDC093801 TaxID=3155203 RepID=UPI00344FE5BA
MDYSKLAPQLAATYTKYQQEGRRRSPLAATGRMLGLVSLRERAKPLRVVVSLVCDPDVPLDGDLGEGVELNAGGKRIRTAIVPMDSLADLAAHPGVRRIVPATQLRPLLDRAQAKVHVPDFRTRTELTGKGVVVGIVDTGIDPRHPAFTGRIDRIWDQTVQGGEGVPEGGYGVEFTGIGAATPSRDTEGHGTHVAGIAAGKDGVAPGARLVMVKTDFRDAHITDGIQYVFRVARDLGLPAVVNLSLGGHHDAHDGTDAMSQAIAEESGPGRIVCCAAGNEGEDDIHAQLTVTEDATASVPCHPGVLRGGPDTFWLNGWYAGTERFEVAIGTPSGASTPFQPVRGPGEETVEFDLPEGTVQITTPGPGPDNGDVNFFVQVDPKSAGPHTPHAAPGKWRLLVRGDAVNGDGRVDVWILGDSEARPQPQFSGPGVDDAMKIGSPGAAASAITVAAFTTRTDWKDIDGVAEQAPSLELGKIAGFSSEGPLRDGSQKPDITAPGAMIVSSLSREAVDQPRALVISQREVAMAGTSMASPFIAGIAALVLQRDPHCDPAAFKSLLNANAAIPGSPQGAVDHRWGHGLLDATGL